MTAAARIASAPTAWSGTSDSPSNQAARATPTTGSKSIRIPARVPPIARIPVRNPMDGIAAAKIPVNSRSGRSEGERTGSTSAAAWPETIETRPAPTTVNPRITAITCSVGTVG